MTYDFLAANDNNIRMVNDLKCERAQDLKKIDDSTGIHAYNGFAFLPLLMKASLYTDNDECPSKRVQLGRSRDTGIPSVNLINERRVSS